MPCRLKKPLPLLASVVNPKTGESNDSIPNQDEGQSSNDLEDLYQKYKNKVIPPAINAIINQELEAQSKRSISRNIIENLFVSTDELYGRVNVTDEIIKRAAPLASLTNVSIVVDTITISLVGFFMFGGYIPGIIGGTVLFFGFQIASTACAKGFVNGGRWNDEFILKKGRYNPNWIAGIGLIGLNILGSIGGGIATGLLIDNKGIDAAKNYAKYILIPEARSLKLREIANAKKQFDYDDKAFKDANTKIRSGENRNFDALRITGPYVSGKTPFMAYGSLPYEDQPLEVKAITSRNKVTAREKELETFDAQVINDEITFVKNNLPEKFLSYYYTDQAQSYKLEAESYKLRSLRDALKATTTSFNTDFLRGKWDDIFPEICVWVFSMLTSSVSIYWLIYYVKTADVEETFNPTDQYKYNCVIRAQLAEEIENQLYRDQAEKI